MEDADEFAVWIGTCLRGLACWGIGPATRLAGIGSPVRWISNQVYAELLAGRAGSGSRRRGRYELQVQTADMLADRRGLEGDAARFRRGPPRR